MQHKRLSTAEKYAKKNKRRGIWKRIVGGLGCLVVFCTTYALILPAITQENAVYCGLEEHTHSEACYELAEQKQLACSPETLQLHVHTDECVDAQGSNICGKADYVAHTHGPECVNAEGTVVCSLPEIGLHIHDEAGCYDSESGEMICAQPEETVHIHTEACFETVTEQTLICQSQEHSHSLACRADATADVETAEDWEKTFGNAELTGSWPEDVIAIAESQLGYEESTDNYIVLEDGATVKGYTRYGQWYGEPYGDWNALFAAFCLNYAGAESVPFDSDFDAWIEDLSAEDCGLYKTAQAHTPAPGDLVFLDRDGDGTADFVGLVTELIPGDGENPATLKIIAGDADDQVQRLEFPVSDIAILGYGDLNTAYADYAQNRIIEKVYTDESVTVKATYPATAGIPEGAELVVKKIQPGDDYESCYQEALEMLNDHPNDITTTQITDFQLYDISFRLDGTEIEPTDKLSVEIIFPDAQLTETADVSVIHYAAEGAKLPEVQEYALDEEGNLNTSFETESFSLYAVVTAETSQRAVTIPLEKYDITSNNISALPSGTAFAIVSGSYALTVNDSGTLTVEALSTLDSGYLSGADTVARWTFEQANGSNYYISTTVNGTKNYLRISNRTLSLSTTQASFAATQTGTNLRLRNSNRYITLSSTGVGTSNNTNSATLSLYAARAFKVTFDGQMGLSKYLDSSNYKYAGAGKETVTVPVTETGSGYVTLRTDAEIASPPNYAYKLNGWYDIVNGKYYDKSMLGQTIEVTSDTIFYPDWVAASYDIGQNENVIADQPDTSEFINTYVFDYNELFNIHSSTYSPSTDLWTFDPNSELGFIFFDYLDDVGNIGNIADKNVAVNGVTVNEEKTRGTRGSSTNFPGTITEGIATDERLKALFGLAPGEKLGVDEYQTMIGRTDLGEGDWLYNYDPETGFYYYNSAKNAAAYNQKDKRFYVYDHTVHIDSQNSLNDFLPFNYDGAENTEYQEKNTHANYWFGMKSEITFFLPYDSNSGKNIAAFEQDMQFRFSGDDDVWIFVDDQLVLDLGGVHDVVYGEINFSTGVIKTGQALTSSAIADNTASSYAGMPGVEGSAGSAEGVTVGTLPTVLEGGREHTITIYYLERGSSLSNCAIYFNVAPSYKLQIEKQDKESQALLDGAEFQIFDDKNCTVPSNLFLLDENGNLIGEETNIFTAEHGVVTIWGMVPGRTYYIKETKPPTAIANHPGYPDMSGTVIQLYLGTGGTQNLVILDSNDNEWVFAETTYYSTTEQLIQLRIYNEAYIGGRKKLYVEKVWEGVNSAEQAPIRVQVYANGEPTGRYLTLSAENDWKGFFYALAETDSAGNEITYTIKEEIPSGFKVQYETTEIINSSTVDTSGWVPATTLEAGETYLLISDQGALGTVNSSSELFQWVDADTALEENKGTHSTQWLATADGNGFNLYSGDGRYMKLYIATSVPNIYASPNSNTSAGTYTSIFNIADGKLRADDYYFTYLGDDKKGRVTQTESDGLEFTLYKWVESEETLVETIPGWIVTNVPLPEDVSIPVQKEWDDTVLESRRTEVTVTLYRVLTESGLIDTTFEPLTLTLNAGNNWTGSFDSVARPPEGSYYCIVENTDGFKVSYSGKTESILIDGTLRDVARVEFDENGDPATVTVTNSAMFLMPETGGSGTTPYITVGLVLMISAAYLLYKSKRRKEAAYS